MDVEAEMLYAAALLFFSLVMLVAICSAWGEKKNRERLERDRRAHRRIKQAMAEWRGFEDPEVKNDGR